MHKRFLTANSLWETPNHLKGYVDILLKKDATIYIPENISDEEANQLEQSIKVYSKDKTLDIVRGEETLLQAQGGILFDFSPRPCAYKWLPPNGWRGKRAGFISLNEGIERTQTELKEAESSLDCILIDRRWDESPGLEQNILELSFTKQFFLPSAWKDAQVQDIPLTTSQETCVLYDSAERPQKSNAPYLTKTLLPILKKSARVTLIDCAYQESKLGKDNFPSKVLSKASRLILAFEDPARLFAWAILAEKKKTPWVAWNLSQLSPMRLAAYGLRKSREAPSSKSIKSFLAPKINLIQQGDQEHTTDEHVFKQSLQVFSPSNVLEQCSSFIQKSFSINAPNERFFYELPQKTFESTISPKHWKRRSLNKQEFQKNFSWNKEYKTKELFEASCLISEDDAAKNFFKQKFLDTFLFRETNNTWHRDFHQLTERWEDWRTQCTRAVENLYSKDKKASSAYTQIAHGMLVACIMQSSNAATLEEARAWIDKDKSCNRYQRLFPYEEVILLGISGKYEEAEGLIQHAYENNTNAYDGFKVLGQVALKYKSEKASIHYYQREWNAHKSSQECNIQYILKQSKKEPLKASIRLLESTSPKAPKIHTPITELAARYIHETATIIGRLNAYPKTKKDCIYLINALENESSAKSSSIQACLIGLTEAQTLGETTFEKLSEQNPHNNEVYTYWALMRAALSDDAATLSILQQHTPNINAFLIFRTWMHAHGIAYDIEKREKLKTTTQSILDCLDICLTKQEPFAENFFLLAQGRLLTGQIEIALNIAQKAQVLGCEVCELRTASWLGWLGHSKQSRKVADNAKRANYPSNNDLLYEALAYSLLGDSSKATPPFEKLLARNPQYFEEQSEARIHHNFCAMLISECIGNKPMAETFLNHTRKDDPLFDKKQQYWNSLKEQNEKTLQAIS